MFSAMSPLFAAKLQVRLTDMRHRGMEPFSEDMERKNCVYNEGRRDGRWFRRKTDYFPADQLNIAVYQEGNSNLFNDLRLTFDRKINGINYHWLVMLSPWQHRPTVNEEIQKHIAQGHPFAIRIRKTDNTKAALDRYPGTLVELLTGPDYLQAQVNAHFPSKSTMYYFFTTTAATQGSSSAPRRSGRASQLGSSEVLPYTWDVKRVGQLLAVIG